MLYLIRYGELALKSRQVRKRFEKTLAENISKMSKKEGKTVETKNIYGRLLIESESDISGILSRTFGIVSFSPCSKISSDLNDIKKSSIKAAKSFKGTFAVECNRTGKHTYTSKEVEKIVGADIVEKFSLGVNLTKPENIIGIDIRDNEGYIYTKNIQGPGGLPVGTAGKVLVIVENNDSSLAAWLMMKRGCDIVVLDKGSSHESLGKWYPGKLNIQNGDPDETAKKECCEAIISGNTGLEFGEKYGIPVFKPLIGMDKNKINELENYITK